MTQPDLSPGTAGRALSGVVEADVLDPDELVRRYALVLWNTLTEPGDSVAWRLVAALGPESALRALERPVSGVARAAGLGAAELDQGRRRWLPRLPSVVAGAGLEAARRTGVRLVVPGDREWPVQLDDLGPHAPLCLWVRGDPAVLRRLSPSVALVGARAATGYGEHVAAELAAELAGGGVPIVSGAAYGIDGIAHRAALAVGGLTVALLAGGVDRPYPAGHTDLIDRIAAAGAVVSEVPCGAAPTRWRFLQRNRLISALSDATVVVEAGWRSGSLNTASHAVSLSRPLGAVPGPVTSAASAGSHRLLREFDAQCITNADDVRELLGLGRDVDPAGAEAASESPPTDDRARVRDALSARTRRDTDEVARRCGMARAEVEAVLGLLELTGEVESGPAGWRRLTGAEGLL